MNPPVLIVGTVAVVRGARRSLIDFSVIGNQV
jgi:hypothetical protein